MRTYQSIDKHLCIGKGMIGGISYIAKRYSRGNNKYMKSYDPNKRSNILHILMETIYMVKHWVNIFLMVDLNG